MTGARTARYARFMLKAALLLMSAGLWAGCCPSNIGQSCGLAAAPTVDPDDAPEPCDEICVVTAVSCPDGRVTFPQQCSGPKCSGPGDCDSGQLCLQVGEAPEDKRCMLSSVCSGEAPNPFHPTDDEQRRDD